jgi:hypothetical protein
VRLAERCNALFEREVADTDNCANFGVELSNDAFKIELKAVAVADAECISIEQRDLALYRAVFPHSLKAPLYPGGRKADFRADGTRDASGVVLKQGKYLAVDIVHFVQPPAGGIYADRRLISGALFPFSRYFSPLFVFSCQRPRSDTLPAPPNIPVERRFFALRGGSRPPQIRFSRLLPQQR